MNQPWISAVNVRSREEASAYLDAAFEIGADNPRFIAHALGVVVRGYGISDLSRQTGIARENLYRSLSQEGNPSLATLCKVVQALGLRFRIEPL